MREDYKNLFNQNQSEPNPDLYQKIITKIEASKVRKARMRFFSVCISGFVSFVALVPVVKYIGATMQNSGFSSYFSILFSGGGLVTYWQDIGLALVESLPVFGLIMFLGVIFVLVNSIKIATKEIGTARLSF